MFISVVILFMLEAKAKKENKEPGSSLSDSSFNTPQQIDESTFIGKLFEGLKEVKIMEVEPEKGNEFKLIFEYDNGTS